MEGGGKVPQGMTLLQLSRIGDFKSLFPLRKTPFHRLFRSFKISGFNLLVPFSAALRFRNIQERCVWEELTNMCPGSNQLCLDIISGTHCDRQNNALPNCPHPVLQKL